jgi:catechol 2,3-dioxygenase-like lactoylglutathione lyase family enzyme
MKQSLTQSIRKLMRNILKPCTSRNGGNPRVQNSSQIEEKRAVVHVSLVVRDYDEAIAFYTKKLHFDLLEDIYQPEQNKRWVLVAPRGANGCSLLLARASKPEQLSFIGNQTGGRVFLFLHTNQFWDDYQKMKSDGIEFVREPSIETYGTVAVFKDLYGNLWDLLELNKTSVELNNV